MFCRYASFIDVHLQISNCRLREKSMKFRFWEKIHSHVCVIGILLNLILVISDFLLTPSCFWIPQNLNYIWCVWARAHVIVRQSWPWLLLLYQEAKMEVDSLRGWVVRISSYSHVFPQIIEGVRQTLFDNIYSDLPNSNQFPDFPISRQIFLRILQQRISNPIKHWGWSFFMKMFKAFSYFKIIFKFFFTHMMKDFI